MGLPRLVRETDSMRVFKTKSRAAAMIWIKCGNKPSQFHHEGRRLSPLPYRARRPAMLRPVAVFLAAAIMLAPAATKKRSEHKKNPAPRHWHGYGFLPGYRPPEVIARERAEHYWASGPHYYGPAWPRFYRGRWNGGGFGPCYTQTPIGYMWNCGQ